MSSRIMGVETEYALSGRDSSGADLSPGSLAKVMMEKVYTLCATLPAVEGMGHFLQNGSRFYIDRGQHPEMSTPECESPKDLIRFISAGDRFVEKLARIIENDTGEISTVEINKSNVNYANPEATWGCHESYMHYIGSDQTVALIISHLVTRILFTGAGGFNPRAPGLRFSLSPRAHYMKYSTSPYMTQNRGLISTRKDKLIEGADYSRLHLLCGESLFCDKPSLLKIGTTALIVAVMEKSPRGLQALALKDPISSMHAIAQDVTFRREVELLNGSTMTALQVQKGFLAVVQNYLGAPWLPSWSAGICDLWSQTLEKLSAGPEAICTSLDWVIKWFVLTAQIKKAGMSWREVDAWSGYLESRESSRRQDALEGEPSGLPKFLALRNMLMALDSRFNTLRGASVFAKLENSGILEPRMLGPAEIGRAMRLPPDGTRAGLRGQAIRNLAGRPGESLASWECVWDDTCGRLLDLADPTETTACWTNRASFQNRPCVG